MGTFLTSDDLPTNVGTSGGLTVDQMIEDAEALAVLTAPCLTGALSAAQSAAVKAILRGAILRWNDSGSGALSAQTAGPFSQTLDTRQERRGMFWPSEIAQLQGVCGSTAGAYSVSVAGPDPVAVVDLGWA